MTRRNLPIDSSRGFTLIELLVVVVVTAILLALAAPSFRQIIQNQRIRAASSDLYASLALARSEAIKRNTNITLSPVGGSWANGWQVSHPSVAGAFLEQHSSLQGISIVTTATNVRFLSSGRVDTGAATFTISGAGASSQRCVSIDLGGRPSVKTC
jgi:type IV fimbrial biogenesis protein FimT